MTPTRTTLIALWTGCAAAIVMGALYQSFLDHLPVRDPGAHVMGKLVAARMFAPIGYGFLIGTVLAWILRRLESTSSNVALVLAVACGAVGDLATFCFAHHEFVAAERSALEQDAALDPAVRSQRIADLEQSTVVDYVCARAERGWRPFGDMDLALTGSAVWLLWGIELLSIVSLAVVIAVLQVPPRRARGMAAARLVRDTSPG